MVVVRRRRRRRRFFVFLQGNPDAAANGYVMVHNLEQDRHFSNCVALQLHDDDDRVYVTGLYAASLLESLTCQIEIKSYRGKEMASVTR